MLQNPKFPGHPAGAAYSDPPDTLADGEEARCPHPRTPPPLVSMGFRD